MLRGAAVSRAINVWTDGACQPNPGAGGWGFTMRGPCGAVTEAIGGDTLTTSNRMELSAALAALRAVPDGASVVAHSDSTYVVHGMQSWRHAWRKRGWRTKKGEPIPNTDLWQRLDQQAQRVHCRFCWLRGHAGDPGNERADALAAAGRAGVLATGTVQP